MRSARRPYASFSLAVSLGIASLASAQTMVEYGHLGGGAATAAAGLRKSAQAASLRKGHGGVASSSAAWGARAATPAPSTPSGRSPENVLTVLRTEWGPSGPEAESRRTLAETSLDAPVSESSSSAASLDLDGVGLHSGMRIAEVSQILGDPDVRTAGLAGRGYDEKALYTLPSGWRVMVYASRGRALDFVASPAPEKSRETILPGGGSVIP